MTAVVGNLSLFAVLLLTLRTGHHRAGPDRRPHLAGGDRNDVVAAVLVFRALTYLVPILLGATSPGDGAPRAGSQF